MTFSKMVQLLSEAGPLYLVPYNYDTVIAYVSGYDNALVEKGEPSNLDSFNLWLHKRVGHHCSLHWSTVITNVFCDGDREVALKRFFEFYREYEQSNCR